MSRPSSTVGFIKIIEPIEGADRIVRADVACGESGLWSAVVPVGTQLNDTMLVFFPDAIVPKWKDLEFMEKYHWRVRMARFKGVASEVVAIPLPPEYGTMPYGYDMDHITGTTKFEKPIPSGSNQVAHWPTFLRRTDEPNFQSVPDIVESMKDVSVYVTVKFDGCSATIYNAPQQYVEGTKFPKIGICSRNYVVSGGPYAAALAEFLDKVPEGIAIQGEVVGPGVQKNPMGLEKIQFYAFSVFDIPSSTYYNIAGIYNLATSIGMNVVPGVVNAMGVRELGDLRTRFLDVRYPNGELAEGVVVRAESNALDGKGNMLSFKVVNPLYKG